jgi:hypothetical protein
VKGDAGFLEGTWTGGGGDLFEVSVVDEDASILAITYDEKRPSGPSNFKTVEARIMVGKQWQYASIPCAEDGSDSSGYFFVCVRASQGRTIIWMPDRMKFRDLVMNNIIPGRVVKEDVILDEITPEMIEIIESCRHGMLFDWQNPLVFTKRTAADNQKDESGS